MNIAKVRVLQLVILLVGLVTFLPAEAQISFRGAGAQVVVTGATLNVALPPGTQAGDFAILVVAGRPSDTSQPSAPTGWTLRSSALQEVGARDLKVVTYYRLLAGGDANPTLTIPSGWQGSQAGISGQIAVWSGVNTTNPFDVADTSGTGAAATPWTPPAITTVTPGALAVTAVASADDNALNLSSPQGFTLRMSGGSYDTTTGGDHSVGVADKDQASAGAVTMPSWAQTVNGPDAWVGITFALKAQPQVAALYYVHSDHLDTPRVITNAAQQVVWRWDNDDPFGNNPPNENPSGLGTFTCNLRLPGQYYDKETNLHYNYFRDYDPAIGRYIQSDPIGLAGGINTYAYVGSNPLSFSDPEGLQFVVPGGGSAVGGFGGIGPLGRPNPFFSQPKKPDDPLADFLDPKPSAGTGSGSSDQCPDPCEGLRRQLQKHKQKLQDYLRDPYGQDNRGFLGQGRDEQVIAGRIRSLQNQIDNFQRQLNECERKNGKRS